MNILINKIKQSIVSDFPISGGLKGANLLSSLVLLLTFSLFSCADDLGLHIDSEENGEDFTGITLLLPDVENAAEFGATRNDDYKNTRAFDQSRESNFNTLYIAAIKVEKDNAGNIISTSIPQVVLKSQANGVEDGYLKYSVSLAPGEYKFYIVSNLNRYLLDDSGNSVTFPQKAIDENSIRKLILNFNSARVLEPGFLPMACLHENLKVGSSLAEATKISGKDATIKIEKNSNKKIYADLNYLCSKVRYTILFNREKSDFGVNSSDVIDIHRHVAENYPYVSYLRRQTAINTIDGGSVSQDFISNSNTNNEINESDISNWPIYLDRYIYGDFDFYDDSKSPEAIKAALSSLQNWDTFKEEGATWTNSTYLNKRAWQGVAYVPENLLKDNPTKLFFPYSFNGMTGANSPREVKLTEFKIKNQNNSETTEYGVSRSKMYDVYMLIKTPDPDQWDLKVIPTAWTLQELAYELHGPYELVVESSVVEKISMEDEAIFWYRSDVPPGEIGFISPQVSITGDDTDLESLRDLFVGGVLKDEDGNYVKNENGDYLFHVGLNLNIPYDVIDKLNRSLASGKDGTQYDKSSISFFHIVAGSLQKRIEIKDLNLDPYLKVTPQTLIIDTRELYTSGEDWINYPITFETNVDPNETSITLTLSDASALIAEGQGEGVLKLVNKNNYKGQDNVYNLTDKMGEFVLNISDIITGNTYWNNNNEYKLTFTLTVKRDGLEDLVITKEVVIKIRPFSGSYVIHFRDNTKQWEDPHIYIFQDLTLPSDMMVRQADGSLKPYEYAGKLVGYVEQNPTSGLQWNAAVQYVFSNNLSFRGWYGNHIAKLNADGTYTPENGNEYGGPEINNPWAKATCNLYDPDFNSMKPTSTMGFVMFGDPYQAKGDKEKNNEDFWFWNYSYSYNVTYQLVPSPDRDKRYNYNVNFNGDHLTDYDNWHCGQCKGFTPDYNNGKNRFYTGITMAKEEDGWWKYTLTGVAQPGRTLIIFANYHEPWSYPGGDYAAEDNRWPGDYEAGLPLFDFEDNEGWFLFDGNTTNSDQRFYDEKPVSKVIPHQFTKDYANKITISVKSSSVSSITVNNISVNRTSTSGNISYFEVNNFSSTSTSIPVVIGDKTYNVAPKNFKYNSSTKRYELAKPLYLEYDKDIELFVKWNDHVSGQGYNPGNGTNYLTVWYGWNSTGSQTVNFTGKEYGNYKYVRFNPDPSGSTTKNQIVFKLSPDSNFGKQLNVEKLPEYYIPSNGYYLINVHKL